MNPALDHLNGLPPLLPREFLGHLERKKEDPPLPVMSLGYGGLKNCLHISNSTGKGISLIRDYASASTSKLHLRLTVIYKSFHYVLRNGFMWGK